MDLCKHFQSCHMCGCVHGVLRCDPVRCPPVNCAVPTIQPPGQCCPICTSKFININVVIFWPTNKVSVELNVIGPRLSGTSLLKYLILVLYHTARWHLPWCQRYQFNDIKFYTRLDHGCMERVTRLPSGRAVPRTGVLLASLLSTGWVRPVRGVHLRVRHTASPVPSRSLPATTLRREGRLPARQEGVLPRVPWGESYYVRDIS